MLSSLHFSLKKQECLALTLGAGYNKIRSDVKFHNNLLWFIEQQTVKIVKQTQLKIQTVRAGPILLQSQKYLAISA